MATDQLTLLNLEMKLMLWEIRANQQRLFKEEGENQLHNESTIPDFRNSTINQFEVTNTLLVDNFNSQIDDDSDEIMAELEELRQVASVKEYYDEFVRVTNRMQLLDNGYGVYVFVFGLKEEIRSYVNMFDPKTLDDAYSLAKLQEFTFNVQKSNSSIRVDKIELLNRKEVVVIAAKGFAHKVYDEMPKPKFEGDNEQNVACKLNRTTKVLSKEVGDAEIDGYVEHSELKVVETKHNGATDNNMDIYGVDDEPESKEKPDDSLNNKVQEFWEVGEVTMEDFEWKPGWQPLSKLTALVKGSYTLVDIASMRETMNKISGNSRTITLLEYVGPMINHLAQIYEAISTQVVQSESSDFPHMFVDYQKHFSAFAKTNGECDNGKDSLKHIRKVQVRVRDGKVVSHTFMQMEDPLDFLLFELESELLLIECYCDFLSEEQLFQAMTVRHHVVKALCEMGDDLENKCGRPILPEDFDEGDVHSKKGLLTSCCFGAEMTIEVSSYISYGGCISSGQWVSMMQIVLDRLLGELLMCIRLAKFLCELAEGFRNMFQVAIPWLSRFAESICVDIWSLGLKIVYDMRIKIYVTFKRQLEVELPCGNLPDSIMYKILEQVKNAIIGGWTLNNSGCSWSRLVVNVDTRLISRRFSKQFKDGSSHLVNLRDLLVDLWQYYSLDWLIMATVFRHFWSCLWWVASLVVSWTSDFQIARKGKDSEASINQIYNELNILWVKKIEERKTSSGI